jgi:hypothetical protein
MLWIMNCNAPGGIRTHGHILRRYVLYPLSYGRSIMIRHHNNNNPCDVSSIFSSIQPIDTGKQK